MSVTSSKKRDANAYLELAPHEAIVEFIPHDIARTRRHGDQTYRDALVGSHPTEKRFTDTNEDRRCARNKQGWVVDAVNLVNVSGCKSQSL